VSGHADRPFECHVTVNEPADRAFVMRDLLAATLWSFSMIDGDPFLGKGTKMYATHHFKTREVAERAVEAMVKLLREADLKVVRAKIEEVIYDHFY
jgi:hypothetical protein